MRLGSARFGARCVVGRGDVDGRGRVELQSVDVRVVRLLELRLIGSFGLTPELRIGLRLRRGERSFEVLACVESGDRESGLDRVSVFFGVFGVFGFAGDFFKGRQLLQRAQP